MPQNIEIKCRLGSPDAAHRLAAGICDGPPELIEQEDTFFPCGQGRLKLRIQPSSPGQLIYYERVDDPGPKPSEYHIAFTETPGELLQVLTLALGVRGVVRKRRWLYRIGSTRLHLDEVEGLGSFLELEVVLAEGQDLQSGYEHAAGLVNRFGIPPEDLVVSAYIDLLEERDETD